MTAERRISHLSSYLGIPFTDLEFDMIDPESVKLIPFSLASELQVIPIGKDGSKLTVAVCRPINIEAREMFAFKTGCSLKIILCENEDF